MGNFEQALVEQIKQLREALAKIRDVPGNDVERLKRIAREALEEK